MTVVEKSPSPERASQKQSFLEAIGRPDLKEILTPSTPWVDFTLETYLEDHGLIGGGGLGMVKGDTARQVAKLDLPFRIFTLFYPTRLKRVIDENFYQQDIPMDPISPEELGFEKLLETSIRVNGDWPRISLFKIPNLSVYTLYEPGLEYLYPSGNNIDHRLYQQVVLGFGGYKSLKELGINPSTFQVDEAVSVFVLLARLDDLCEKTGNLKESLEILRTESLGVNHTNVPAAVSTFSGEQFKRYVMPNLKTNEVRNWIGELIDSHGGSLNLSVLMLELAGTLSGVSRIHGEASSRNYKHLDGRFAEHQFVTNGIFFDKWVMPELLKMYQDVGAIDEHDLPSQDYKSAIRSLSSRMFGEIKETEADKLKGYLTTRVDQYGRPIEIDDETEIGVWAKRIAGYKRPGMVFSDPQRLARILEEWDFDLILSGNAHPSDELMKQELQRTLWTTHGNETLRQRVHYVQGYDGSLATPLVRGVKLCFNTPQVWDEFGNRINTEADGTFWKKAIACGAILISTRDGGVADVDNLPCLEITGRNHYEEVDSLYENFAMAAAEVRDFGKWEKRVKDQLEVYLPLLSGSRMIRDNFNLKFPRKVDAVVKAA